MMKIFPLFKVIAFGKENVTLRLLWIRDKKIKNWNKKMEKLEYLCLFINELFIFMFDLLIIPIKYFFYIIYIFLK